MTLINQGMESSKALYKNTSFLSRKNTTRKTTTLKGLKSMNAVTLNSIQDVTTSNLNQELAKKLKERLQRFIVLSFMLFHGQIIETASKYPRPKQQNTLGSTTTVLRKHPFIIEPNLFEDYKPNLNLKMISGNMVGSINTFDSFETLEFGGSPKLDRTSMVRLSGNDEFPDETNFGSSPSIKKLEEPPSLNPLKNAIFMNNYNKNPLEMIQEEMEDRNYINDKNKFNDTNNRFMKKLETIKESVHLMSDSQGKANNEDIEQHFRQSSFNLMADKSSKFLSQAEIEDINLINEKKKSYSEEENKEPVLKEEDKEPVLKEEEKIEELSTNSEKFVELGIWDRGVEHKGKEISKVVMRALKNKEKIIEFKDNEFGENKNG